MMKPYKEQKTHVWLTWQISWCVKTKEVVDDKCIIGYTQVSINLPSLTDYYTNF